MKVKTITKEWLKKHEACGEAVEAWGNEKDHGTIATLRRLIRRNQLDWANWLITRDGILTKSQRQNYANYAIEKAIRLVLKYYKNPDYVRWAKKWLDGEDRSAYAARAAAYAAADATYAADAVMKKKILRYGMRLLND